MELKHFQFLAIAIPLATLQACSTLPHRQPVTVTTATEYDTSHTLLADQFTQIEKQHPGKTGFHVLYDPTKAMATRLELIDKAQKTLDLQYYIWDNDRVGGLALDAILRAADRGVKIRLLLDDNNTQGLQAAYYVMAKNPNIQIRVFNPFRFRKARFLDYAFDFRRMTHRMHNKTFIADHEVALIGGRNMSNQYFDAGENFQFSDLDVVLVGQSVNDISQSFDDYWNDEYAYPIQQIIKKPPHLSMQSLRRQLETNREKCLTEDYLGILSNSLSFDTWFNKNLELQWVDAKVIKDPPSKIRDHKASKDFLIYQMANTVETPKHKIDLVSAYFVPDKEARNYIKKLRDEHVEIRVVTNSFKANDVPIVHSFYAKHRMELLKEGVELYEFLPNLGKDNTYEIRRPLFKSTKYEKSIQKSSLHAKFMALDNTQVFIGSFNFDPRSAYLNTEIGVVLNSPELAQEMHKNMDQSALDFAYHVKLDPNGKIIWQRKVDDEIKTYHKEPNIHWWQKITLGFLSWLPLEKQM